MDHIPVAGPWITQKEIDYVTDAVTNAWHSNHNMYHVYFESAFAVYIGRKYAITLPSCTSALHLSLATLGLDPDSEVIVPDITWIASSAPVTYVGATPVFADIDPKSWCLSAQSFEENISPQTRAVIVIDLYGNMPDMDAIFDVARKHDIVVIEDAAQAIGSEYKGRKAGSFGVTSTFSFHGTKTLTTGEGGMLVTDDEQIYRRCLFLRDHGRQPGEKMFWNTEIAYKYKMSSMQAALGLAQLERMEELVERKREIFSWYQEALMDVEGIILNYEAPEVMNTYWMVTVILDPEIGLSKEKFMKAMADKGISCRPFFYPLSSLPAYTGLSKAGIARSKNVNAYRISPFAVNLPSGFNMTKNKVVFVCNQLKEILADRDRNM